MSKHTPGPWYVNDLGPNPFDNERHYEVCYGKDDECICDTVYTNANARLIAAAPDLLEALKEIIEYDLDFLPTEKQSVEYKKAVAAIRKAEDGA